MLKKLVLPTSTFVIYCLLIGGCNDNNSPTQANAGDTSSTILQVSDFMPSDSCQRCHPDQFDQWSGSMHAYALTDPVFSAVRDLGQSAYALALDGACTKCHSPIGQRTGAIQWGPFELNALPSLVQDAVGCELCHTVTALKSISNAGLVLSPGNVKYGPIADPVSNNFHESEFHPLYQESEYCGACHDLITDNGLKLEAVFREWQQSGFAVTGKDCFDCHMETYQGSVFPGGPVRTLHRHDMIGADLALVDFPFRNEQLQRVTQTLRSAITLQISVPSTYVAGQQFDFQISLLNENTGHNVPSGVPFNRQMWLSIEVNDDMGIPLYRSGDLDANGDLKNEYSAYSERDSDLFNAQATMLRADSTPTGATWEAAYLTNPSIKPGELRNVNYGFQVPPATTGDLSLIVRLRFRSFPPYVFRGLGLDSLLPIPIIDMAGDTITVSAN